MIVVLGHNVHTYRKDVIFAGRNFYGPVRVKLFYDWLKQPYHTLYNGIIEHAAQSSKSAAEPGANYLDGSTNLVWGSR